MSGHLPECQKIVWITSTHVVDNCICPALRACEQRVRDEEFRLLPKYRQAHDAGVQAARDAVAALTAETNPHAAIYADDALAAIDALRGDA